MSERRSHDTGNEFSHKDNGEPSKECEESAEREHPAKRDEVGSPSDCLQSGGELRDDTRVFPD